MAAMNLEIPPLSTRLKVLHVLDHSLPVHSGYAFRSQSILQNLLQHGTEAWAITSPKHYESWSEPWLSPEDVEGVRYYRTRPVQASRWPLVGEIRVMSSLANELRAIVRKWQPHVIHAHSPTLNAIPAILVGNGAGIPVVYEVRSSWEDAAVDRGTYGSSSWKYRLGRRLETFVCRHAHYVTVICEGLKREMLTRGISEDKLAVIPNGVDVTTFQPCQPDSTLLEKWNLQRKRVIGFMGSFFRWEGLDLLIEAFARMSLRREDLALLLIGGGEMRADLEKKVYDLGLANVVMPGSVEPAQIPKIYAMVDVLAYPRRSMRLTEMVTPLKPLEAMAMGKALVASDVGGHKELIQHGKTGILFKAGSVDGLVEALENILAEESLRCALEKQGRKWVEDTRQWNAITRDYLPIYRNLLN